jgi:transposase
MCSVASLKRRVYTLEYRVEAARLVIDTGRPIAQVAREIGVGEALLGRWVAKERDRGGGAGSEPLELDERAELERLRRENQELRLDVAFLGKASAFFAARSQFKTGSS